MKQENCLSVIFIFDSNMLLVLLILFGSAGCQEILMSTKVMRLKHYSNDYHIINYAFVVFSLTWTCF